MLSEEMKKSRLKCSCLKTEEATLYITVLDVNGILENELGSRRYQFRESSLPCAWTSCPKARKATSSN